MRFSSPAGVLYFKIPTNPSFIMSSSSFRPLLGFFISKYFNDVAHLICIVVFVPCWGSLFQNFSTIPHKAESENRFRPLLGFFISK